MLARLRRLFRILGRDAVVLWFACRNPATPKHVKLGTLLLALYLFSPIDLIPDTFLLFGWMDDVTIACFLLPVLVRRLPPSVRMQADAAADRVMSRWRFGANRP